MNADTERMARELQGRLARLDSALSEAHVACRSYSEGADWVSKEKDPETAYSKRIGQRLYFARIELQRAVTLYERLMAVCAADETEIELASAQEAGEAESKPADY